MDEAAAGVVSKDYEEEEMRLIDADALMNELMKVRWGYQMLDNTQRADIAMGGLRNAEKKVEEAPTIDAVPVETVCEMFGDEAPCNYGLFGVSVDDFMMSKCGEWCEDNCDKVPYTECWRKFFEAIEKWRKQND